MAEAARARASDLRSVFAIRAFAIYQGTAVAMTIGFWMQRVAVGWLVWQMTRSESWLGLVAFAELFPAILTGLAGGAMADRGSAPRVLFLGNLGLTVISALLCALAVAGLLTPVVILVLMAAIGAVSGLVMAARLSMASFLVPRALLSPALAVNATGFNMSRFIGPAVAGGILAVGPASWVFGLSALGYAVFSLGLHAIRDVPPQIARAPRAAGDSGSAWAVVRTMPETPVILGVVLIQMALGVLIRPASELFPAFAEQVFDRGAAGLGALNAALGVGAVAGALALSRTRETAAALRQILLGSAVFAVSLLAFVVTGNFVLALAVLAVHGAAMSASNIAALSFVQTNTPSDRLGRVLSLYALVFRAGPAFGAFMFGVTAERIGLGASGILFGLAGMAVIAGLGSFVIAAHRRRGAV